MNRRRNYVGRSNNADNSLSDEKDSGDYYIWTDLGPMIL
jgi:hypothetical protein